MIKTRRSALFTLVICLLACTPSQCCRSAGGNARSSHNDLTAGRKTEAITKDPDWEVDTTARIPQTAQYVVSCTQTAYCWLWDDESLWAYDQQHQLRRISFELNENEHIVNGFLLSPEVGWIVSYRGLFQTSDGGQHWTRINIPQFDSRKGSIHAVYFIDEKHGWIAGGRYQVPLKGEALPNNALSDDRKRVLVGAVSKTADGGSTWQDIELERSLGRFYELIFSGSLGLVSGDAGLKVTTDGGAIWRDRLSAYRQKDTGELPEVIGSFLLDERRGWVSLSAARIISTGDGGRSWSAFYPSVALDPAAAPFGWMVFVDKDRGVAVQSSLGGGQLYKTNNAGKTWSPILTGARLSGLARVPGSKLVIAVGRESIFSLTPRQE